MSEESMGSSCSLWTKTQIWKTCCLFTEEFIGKTRVRKTRQACIFDPFVFALSLVDLASKFAWKVEAEIFQKRTILSQSEIVLLIDFVCQKLFAPLQRSPGGIVCCALFMFFARAEPFQPSRTKADHVVCL